MLAHIDVWNVRQVASYLSGFDAKELDSHGRPPGFALLNERFISRARSSESYPDPSTLPLWQRQPHGECPSSTFDRAIVAQVGPCVTGILYCEWMRMRNGDPFWGYHLAFVDIHKSWRGLGLASALFRDLDSQEWLRGKILQLSSYTREGSQHLRHVIRRELKADEYMMLSCDYDSTALPETVGRWHSRSTRY